MRTGSHRADVPYLWPRTLRLPERPPALVYLDLNHWIALARAAGGHEGEGPGREFLDWALGAVEKGLLLFPISGTTYSEISRISAHRQRRDLRHVIERLSGFAVVASRVVIATHEIEATLDLFAGPSSRPINEMDYLDWGVARAFGLAGGFRVKDADGCDVTADVGDDFPNGPGAFDQLMADATRELNRRSLEGPTHREEPALRRLGWNPQRALEVNDHRARQENDQVAVFNDHPGWRKGRIRDVIAARELLVEMGETMIQGLVDRGVDWDALLPPDVESVRARIDAMPSVDVSVTLKTSYHRDPNHRWTANDIFDIDALATTLPYCDVVVMDRAMHSHVERTGLADRLGATALHSLIEVPDVV